MHTFVYVYVAVFYTHTHTHTHPHTHTHTYIYTTTCFGTVILPFVWYGCETWSLTLREESRLRMFENRVVRRIFGPTGGEVAGEWRKLTTEELNDLYRSPNIIRVIFLSFQLLFKIHVTTRPNVISVRVSTH